jgi:cyclopropane-fatty-acyl-phospholipid synthase
MTSTQRDIEVSYDVSNEFFRLWLDDRMHYTSASFTSGRDNETLEEAQINKSKILYDYAEMNPDKLILDIGCGWGANLEFLVSQGVKRIHGITLSTAQHDEILAR